VDTARTDFLTQSDSIVDIIVLIFVVENVLIPFWQLFQIHSPDGSTAYL